jgi:hypothetical protein
MEVGTFAAQSGREGPAAASTDDCGIYPSFNIDAPGEARYASSLGLPAEATPRKALRYFLKNGDPFHHRSLIAFGYPATGWELISGTSDGATFRAPLHSGTAELTFTRVDGHWWLSRGWMNC